MVIVRPAIVALPDRGAPAFACTPSLTVPLPVPEAPSVTLIHGAPLDDVQAQPAGAVTATLVSPAAAAIVTCSGVIVKRQASPCETVNVRPPIVSVPERWGPPFAAAVNPTVPLPVPAAPDEIESQLTSLVAVQLHPPPAVTLTVPFPPLTGASNVVDAREIEQPLPCVTVNVRPAAVIAPLRDGPVFLAAVKRTVPWPVPVVPDEIVSHGTVEVALQPQPDPVCTTNDPDPPSSSMVPEVAESVKAQPSPWFSVNVRPAMVSVPLRAGPLVAAAAY
jgi:hypothetical protein